MRTLLAVLLALALTGCASTSPGTADEARDASCGEFAAWVERGQQAETRGSVKVHMEPSADFADQRLLDSYTELWAGAAGGSVWALTTDGPEWQDLSDAFLQTCADLGWTA